MGGSLETADEESYFGYNIKLGILSSEINKKDVNLEEFAQRLQPNFSMIKDHLD